ncbi:MAG: hypothetical protein ACRC9K_09595 [Afipia sp.]
MPRKAKRARLWLRPNVKDRKGQVERRSAWIVLDRGKYIVTGCLAHEAEAAEKFLANYIAQKHQPIRQRLDIEDIAVADVLSIYVDDKKLHESERALQAFARLERLNEYWGALKLADINGETCREYVR